MNLFNPNRCCCSNFSTYSTFHTGVSPGLQVYDLSVTILNSGLWGDSGQNWPSVNNNGCNGTFISGQELDSFPYLTQGYYQFFYDHTSGDYLFYNTVPLNQYNGVSGSLKLHNLGVAACYGDFLNIIKVDELRLTQSNREIRLGFDRNSPGLSFTNHIFGVNTISGIPNTGGTAKVYNNGSLSSFYYGNLSGVLRQQANGFISGSLGTIQSLNLTHNVAIKSAKCNITSPTGNVNGTEFYNSAQCELGFRVQGNLPFFFDEDLGTIHWISDGTGIYRPAAVTLSDPLGLGTTCISNTMPKFEQYSRNFLATQERSHSLFMYWDSDPHSFESWAQYTASVSGQQGGVLSGYETFGTTISGQCRVTGILEYVSPGGIASPPPSYRLTGISSTSLGGTTYGVYGYVPDPDMSIAGFGQVGSNPQTNTDVYNLKTIKSSDYPTRHTLCPLEQTFQVPTSFGTGTIILSELTDYDSNNYCPEG